MKIVNVIALIFATIIVSVIFTNYFIKKPTTTPELTSIAPLDSTDVINQKITATLVSSNQQSPEENQKVEIQPIANTSIYSEITDHQSTDAFFINSQGTVDSGAITKVAKNMNKFIQHISNLPLDSELAIKRDSQLKQQLLELKEANIFDQHLACAGRICAISLIADEISAENKAHLARFDSNISFVSLNTNESGEVEFKAIYLHTDDPSNLVMTQP
ncbi:hypothetical protein [Shewanella sp. GutDb-MelDb]|uniref:hypothetical protein n=1 Tax=Shewanella sp. GutDb-MelDb TaxID=2058316 RepID=UPI000C7BF058|nr:hypothetical protein [Shewanella sp. GutDb-MelDb]PKG58654.1 hypothetical protein CXF82_03495 [Shewanella sp. GutDb-MelDb]